MNPAMQIPFLVRFLFLQILCTVLFFGLLPSFSSATADIVFENDTVITLDGHDYTIVSGSQANSLDIGDTSITITVPVESTFTLLSAERFVLENDQNFTFTCTNNISSIALSLVTSLILTPDTSTVCTPPSGTTSAPSSYVSTSYGSVSVLPSQRGLTTLSAPDGTKASLVIPKDAVHHSVRITVRQLSADPSTEHLPSGTTLVPGTLVEYKTSPGPGTVLADTETLRTFLSPVQVSITPSERVEHPDAVAIYRNDESGDAWEVLSTTYDPSTNTFSADTLHFSVFALLESAKETTPETSPVLTQEQIKSILNLLKTFGADTAVITRVGQVLGISSLPTAPPLSSQIPTNFRFTINLTPETRGEDVRYLQVLLNLNAATLVAASGPGSPGSETLVFGKLTKAAVIAFQKIYATEILAPFDLSVGTGFVGPATRAKLNELLGG